MRRSVAQQAGFWLLWSGAGFVLLSCTSRVQLRERSETALRARLDLQTSSKSDPTDFSYAGYRSADLQDSGSETLVDVRAAPYFARGDGSTSARAAIQAALDDAKPGSVIYLPAGDYLIDGVLWMKRLGVRLVGAGPDQTRLHFSVPLSRVLPGQLEDEMEEEDFNERYWSRSGGLIWVLGGDPKGELVPGSWLPASKGELTLESENEFDPPAAGEWIVVLASDPVDGPEKGTLLAWLNGSMDTGSAKGRSNAIQFVSRIVQSTRTRLILERALPYPLRQEWNIRVKRFSPAVTQVGIENLELRMPAIPKESHHQEVGFNAIEFSGVAQSWVKDVRIVNADNGIRFEHTWFCNVERVVLQGSRARGEFSGHHGISMSTHAHDNRIVDFRIDDRFLHDLTVSNFASGNVFSRGIGRDLNLDHHRRAPHHKLFELLDLGAGSRAFESSGRPDAGTHSGRGNVYWNLRAEKGLSLPPSDFGSALSFVGGDFRKFPGSLPNRWTQIAPGSRVEPKSLFETQCQARAGCL